MMSVVQLYALLFNSVDKADSGSLVSAFDVAHNTY